jgi:hypothetical protein
MGIVKKNEYFVEKHTEYYHQNGKEVIWVNYKFSLLDQPDSGVNPFDCTKSI